MEAVQPYTTQTIWERSRGLIAIAILSPFLVAALFSKPYVGEGTLGDLELDVLGFLLFMAGAMFRFWAILYVGGRKGDELVTHGPYSLCRNPLYFGSFLMLASLAVYLQNLTFSIGVILASLVYFSITVRSEERRLRDRFCRHFEAYCAAVPRFWPNLRHYDAPETIEVSTWELFREFLNALRWLWIPIAGETLAYARTHEWLPALFRSF
jgi:protein-S-isoprenylcysteine O-methyltransferase Ste14